MPMGGRFMMRGSRFLLIGLAALLLSGCQPKEPIRIGFAGGITGANASVALSGRDAVLLAVEEVNQAGGIKGRPVELVIKDDQESPAVAAEVEKAFLQEGVPVVIGHYVSGVVFSALEAIKGQNLLMLSPTISTAQLSGLDDQFIRVIPTNEDQGRILGMYASKAAGNTTACVIYSVGNEAFVDGVKGAFRQRFESLGGQVLFEEAVPPKQPEAMSAALERGISAGVDAYLLVMNANDVAIISQLRAKAGYTADVYSATWGMTSDVLFQGGSTVEGIVFPAPFDSSSREPEYQAFSEKYQKFCGNSPDFSAVYSYEAARILFGAIEKASEYTAEEVKHSLLSGGSYHGLQSELTFTDTGDIKRPLFLVTVKNGSFETIGTGE